MDIASRQIGLIASLGSVALLGGAWLFQALGYAPCAMCIWQRYPHAVAIGIGFFILAGSKNKILFFAGSMAAATTASIGVYHTGVERDWWQGPTSCTGSGLDASVDLLSTDVPINLVMCDEVAWEFFTLSMASWNAVFSFVLAGIWLAAALSRQITTNASDTGNTP
jgi:disulfide bond formation protein DsbB